MTTIYGRQRVIVKGKKGKRKIRSFFFDQKDKITMATGEGHFRKVFQDGEPVATEQFVASAVQTGTGGIFPTHAELDTALASSTLTVHDADNLGGVAASAYQKVADTPQTHQVTYCLDGPIHDGSGNVITVPTAVLYADMNVVSYTVSPSGLLRSSGLPLTTEKSFTLVQHTFPINVLVTSQRLPASDGIYSCSLTPGGLEFTRAADQPKSGDVVVVNIASNVTVPADFWHPNWGTQFVLSDTQYVLQSEIAVLSSSWDVPGAPARVETFWVLESTQRPMNVNPEALATWLDTNTVPLGGDGLVTRKPTVTEIAQHVHYTNGTDTGGNPVTDAYFPYYCTHPQYSAKAGLAVLHLMHPGSNVTISAATLSGWTITTTSTIQLNPNPLQPSDRNRSLVRVLLQDVSGTMNMYSAVNLSRDHTSFVVVGDTAVFPYPGTPMHTKRITQHRTHIEGYQEASASRFTGALTVSGGLGVTGDIHADNVYADSDASLKYDVDTLSPKESMQAIMDLQPRKYRWNNRRTQAMDYGFLAQEAKNCVAGDVKVDPRTGLHSMNTNKIIPFLVGAMQHLQSQNARTVGPKRKRGKHTH